MVNHFLVLNVSIQKLMAWNQVPVRTAMIMNCIVSKN